MTPAYFDKRLLVIEAELARTLRVMGRKENTLSAIARDAWDGARLAIMTRNRPITATGALISLVGHITIVELRAELTEVQTANGFGNRCLLACSKRSKLLPHGGEVDPHALEALAAKLRHAFSALPHGRITFDPMARALWEEVYPELSKGGTRLFDAMTARSEAQAVRVALIYALLDGQQQIGRAHLEAALEIIRYSNDSVRHIFGDATGNRTADTIIKALRACPEGMTRTALSSDLFGRNVKADEIGTALALLLEYGMAYPKRIDTDGRPKEVWFAC